VCLADTGVGKDTPLTIPERVLRAAGLERLHTTGNAFSISALEQMMIKRPRCVVTVDEIGASLFGRMSHKRANANELDMRGFLLEMYSRDQFKGPFGLTKRAQQLEKLRHPIPDAIARPNLTVLGASGPKRFWESIAPGSIQDGFLNRSCSPTPHRAVNGRRFPKRPTRCRKRLRMRCDALCPPPPGRSPGFTMSMTSWRRPRRSTPLLSVCRSMMARYACVSKSDHQYHRQQSGRKGSGSPGVRIRDQAGLAARGQSCWA